MSFINYCLAKNSKTEQSEDILRDECFVCYEFATLCEVSPIRLKNQALYIRECKCDGVIHRRCLEEWYKMNKRCPICRIYVLDRNLRYVRYVIQVGNMLKYVYKLVVMSLFIYIVTNLCIIGINIYIIVYSRAHS